MAFSRKSIEGLNRKKREEFGQQDGRIERRTHPFLTKTPKSQLTAEYLFAKKDWNLPRYYTFKDKEKAIVKW